MTTRLRPALLRSTIARKQLDHLGDWPRNVFDTIEQMGDIHDGLATLRDVDDPSITPEARAVKYREAHQRAVTRVDKLIEAAVSRLVEREHRIRAEAWARAGLDKPTPLAGEIRAALRAMKPADRDRAVTQAVETGDADVIRAIQGVPALLRGDLTMPVETVTQMFVERTSPAMTTELAEVNTALETLNLSAGAWRRAAADMRDVNAERRADEGAERQRKAEWQLGVAMQGRAPS